MRTKIHKYISASIDNMYNGRIAFSNAMMQLFYQSHKTARTISSKLTINKPLTTLINMLTGNQTNNIGPFYQSQIA